MKHINNVKIDITDKKTRASYTYQESFYDLELAIRFMNKLMELTKEPDFIEEVGKKVIGKKGLDLQFSCKLDRSVIYENEDEIPLLKDNYNGKRS